MFELSFHCIHTILTSRHHHRVAFPAIMNHFVKQLVQLIQSSKLCFFCHLSAVHYFILFSVKKRITSDIMCILVHVCKLTYI